MSRRVCRPHRRRTGQTPVSSGMHNPCARWPMYTQDDGSSQKNIANKLQPIKRSCPHHPHQGATHSISLTHIKSIPLGSWCKKLFGRATRLLGYHSVPAFDPLAQEPTQTIKIGKE